MEQAGLTAKDLVPAIGQLNRVYEVLGRKRPLPLNMIWRLHEEFGIPAGSLGSLVIAFSRFLGKPWEQSIALSGHPY